MRVFALLLVLFAYPVPAFAEPVVVKNLTVEKEFPFVRQVLESYAKEEGRANKTNSFCVVVYKTDADSRVAYVQWQEGKRLILWEPPSELEFARRTWDISEASKDVVDTQEEVGSSTYIVTRQWVNDILGTCREHGEQITIPAAR